MPALNPCILCSSLLPSTLALSHDIMVFMAELSSLHSRDSHRIGPTLTMTQSQQAAIPIAAIPTKLESTAGRVGSVNDFKAWQGESERLRCVG